jgi:hypothetical protein
MATARFAIAAALFAAMTAFASAQAPSYESRGYGGPLYVGPDFQHGGQHSPPVYGQGSSAKERPAKEYSRKRHVEHEAPERKARAAKATDDDDTDDRKATDNDKAAPAEGKAQPAAAENENSSISQAAAAKDKAPEAKSAGPAGTESENSSISETQIIPGTASEKTTAASGTPDEPKAGQNVGCKKYFPWAGMTLTVPCESR